MMSVQECLEVARARIVRGRTELDLLMDHVRLFGLTGQEELDAPQDGRHGFIETARRFRVNDDDERTVVLTMSLARYADAALALSDAESILKEAEEANEACPKCSCCGSVVA